MIEDLIRRNRSYRRFSQDPVDIETLRWLIGLARESPSGANLQALKFILSCDADTNAAIFPHLRWAGYLRDWPGPATQRPARSQYTFSRTAVAQGRGIPL